MGLLPDNYKSAKEIKGADRVKDSRYVDPSDLNDGDSVTIRPCGTHASGHVIAGYTYYSETMKRTRRFPVFPDRYLEDIGLTYKGRVEKTGEKDLPKYFLSITGLSKETGGFVVLTVPQLKLREQLERAFAMEDYFVEDGAMANFYLTISRSGTGTDTTYGAMPTLKPATAADQKKWQTAASGIWLPAMFAGADPFAGKPAEARPEGLPPTSRDDLGADVEVLSGAPTAW